MDEYDEYKDEYKQIQGLHELWSKAIMDWIRLMVPIGTVLFGFFSYIVIAQLENFRHLSSVWLFPLFGWGIFATVLIVWRLIVCHMDKQIVRMYPRMLELEQRLNWATHARYYYNNLSRHAREYLAQRLEQAIDPKKEDYRRYEEKAKEKGKDPYSLLLEVWDKYQYKSVTSRGHDIQNIAVIMVIVIAFGVVSVLSNLIISHLLLNIR